MYLRKIVTSKRMLFEAFISSTFLATLAIIIWLLSLHNTALIFGRGYQLTGLDILKTGWLGLLALNLAWYSNIFFFIAAYKLIAKKACPNIQVITAIILSFNSLTYTSHLLDEGGASIKLYGYGLGFYFWIVSMWLLLAAVGKRDLEKGSSEGKIKILASILFLCSFSYFVFYQAFQDRANANIEDKALLSKHSILFKKGDICSIDVAIPSEKISSVNIIEIENPSNLSPFNNVETLLKWGFKTVRIEDYDYFLIFEENTYVMSAKPKKGDADALITTSSLQKGSSNIITIYLNDLRTNEVIFSQEWVLENKTSCPLYSSYYPREIDNPRKLIISSINGLDAINEQTSSTISRAFNIESTMISISQEKYPFSKKPNNLGCNDDFGIINYSTKSSDHRIYPRPFSKHSTFKAEQQLFFLDRHFNAICHQGSYYLYETWTYDNDKKLAILLNKREHNTFKSSWYVDIRLDNFPEKPPGKHRSFLTIDEVTSSEVIFNITDLDTSMEYKVKAFLDKPRKIF